MYRTEIDAEEFRIFKNTKTYRLDWLHDPKLTCDSVVDVGIDQSSTSTGLCIQGDNLLVITELPRGFMSVNQYKRVLIEELICLLGELNIRHFVYEKHKHIADMDSIINQVTSEIRKYSRQLRCMHTKVVGVSPPVWRKGFLGDGNFKGQFNRDAVKLASVTQAININPLLEDFRKHSQKDYDGFEAFGIINGYLKLNYTKDGTRIVNTSMDYRNGRRYEYLIFKCQKTQEYVKVQEILTSIANTDCPIIESNQELLLENSLNRVIGEYDEAILRFPKHSEFPRFILEIGEPYAQNEMFLVYVRKIRGF